MPTPTTLRSFVDLQDASSIEASEGNAGVPDMIHVLSTGKWDSAKGKFQLSTDDLDEMVKNFNEGVRKGVPIDAEHKTTDGAYGWFESVQRRGQQLWAKVDWNRQGRAALEDKQYRFFSPEFAPNFQDPETKMTFRNVLLGGAITNRPLMKGLKPIMASEQASSALYLNEESPMDDDKKTEEVAPAVASATEEKKEEVVAASETVTISASEMEEFKQMKLQMSELVEQAASAKEELRVKSAGETVKGWIFSESNPEGRFAPTVQDDLQTFVLSLNEGQASDFSALVAKMPKVAKNMFKETGETGVDIKANESEVDDKKGDTGMKGEAAKQLEIKANELSEKKGISYGKAMLQVRRENAVMASEADSENAPVRVASRFDKE